MFFSAFASMGIRLLKATSIEATEVLRCPLLLNLLFSSCCRENDSKEKTFVSRKMFWLFSS